MSERPAHRLETIRCEAYNDDPLRVARVAQSIPDESSIDSAAALFSSLAHPVRVAIATALAQEPLCVCELSALLGMSSPAVMYHLKAMASAGVLDVRKAGRFAEYYIIEPKIGEILNACLSASVNTGGNIR